MGKSKVILTVTSLIAAVVIVVSFIVSGGFSRGAAKVETLDKAKLIYERAEDLLKTGKGDKAIYAFNTVISQYPASAYTGKSLKNLAEISVQKGEYIEADQYYSRLLKDFPAAPDAKDIRAKLDEISKKIINLPLVIEGNTVHEVQSGDSLYGIAKKYNTTVELIKKINGLESDVIRAGQKLKVTTSTFSIFVSKSRNILILKKDDKPVKTYIVATGKDNSTPVGTFVITDKMVKPTWTKPGVGLISPDSPEYELGARWIPISSPGIGIHGTDNEASIGLQSTHGCVRMYNKDVIELYDVVPRGTKVEIVD